MNVASPPDSGTRYTPLLAEKKFLPSDGKRDRIVADGHIESQERVLEVRLVDIESAPPPGEVAIRRIGTFGLQKEPNVVTKMPIGVKHHSAK